MRPPGRASTAPLLRLDFLRLFRDPKLVVVLAAILGTSLFAAEVRDLLTNVALLFLPVLVGWSWGADFETGALVPMALAGNGPLRFFFVRLAVLLGSSLLAVLPTLLDPQASWFSRACIVGGVASELLLGFLLITATRNSHAGWIPIFLAIGGVFLPWVRMMRTDVSARPPLWLWLLGSTMFPGWTANLVPGSRPRILAVLLAASVLFAAGTVSILHFRAGALERRR
jgi:hypothetical protein